MSRAFVRESDQASGEVHERPVSAAPNFVTVEGLRQIEQEMRRLEAEKNAAREGDDATALAAIARDLRYWQQRHATARLVEPPKDPDVARFGCTVTLAPSAGDSRTFRIVGEDEADPAHGRISWASPLARSLIGREVGDSVEFQGARAEIVAIE